MNADWLLRGSATIAGAEPHQPAFDETVAANPEEIDLDDLDADSIDGAALQDAEAAKQNLGQDHSMFQSDVLHNYSSVHGLGT